jgi:HPt (histidine-containing phosphotransfer) domain-containing protein
MTTRGGRDDLETRVDELETTLAELRQELRPRRGPVGLPRPPRPREFLQFTERYALPTVIAMLEAQIRALEGLQAVLRAMDRGRDANERVDSTRERAESLGRETLDALDRTLEDLRNAVETGGLPNSPEARNLLSDAQRLTEEIESELRDVPSRRERDVEAVEEEIRILKDEFDEEDSEDRG